MKRLIAVATLVAAFSLPALAAKNSENVSVPSPVKAGATQIAPGDYEVTWTGTGSDVQVTFARYKKIIATFPAKLVQETNKNVGLETDSRSGTDVLHAIRMHNLTLVIGAAPSSGQ